MLRFGILASVIPLVVAGGMVRDWFVPAAQPCIPIGMSTVQMTSAPWQADLHVAFTTVKSDANVRVQIVDRPELADFVVADDSGEAEANACAMTAATRFIAIGAYAAGSEPLIYLSRDDDADYRIFVSSRNFTAKEAAALVVGAHRGGPARVAAAAL